MQAAFQTATSGSAPVATHAGLSISAVAGKRSSHVNTLAGRNMSSTFEPEAHQANQAHANQGQSSGQPHEPVLSQKQFDYTKKEAMGRDLEVVRAHKGKHTASTAFSYAGDPHGSGAPARSASQDAYSGGSGAGAGAGPASSQPKWTGVANHAERIKSTAFDHMRGVGTGTGVAQSVSASSYAPSAFQEPVMVQRGQHRNANSAQPSAQQLSGMPHAVSANTAAYAHVQGNDAALTRPGPSSNYAERLSSSAFSHMITAEDSGVCVCMCVCVCVCCIVFFVLSDFVCLPFQALSSVFLPVYLYYPNI